MSRGYSLYLHRTNREASAVSIGVRLGRFCIEHDVSVRDVARALGVSRTTVYNWFNGDTVPSDEMAPLIEHFMGEME